jgi:hypothetical protein
MVQLLLSVVQQGLRETEVATEWSVSSGLVGKAIGIDPPVVLVVCTQQLVVVEVDEVRDSMSQNMHQSITPGTLNHLEGEPLTNRRDLLPADLADNLVSQLSGTLLEEAVTTHLGTRASETRSQLHQVALKDEHVLVGTNLTVCSRSVHLHKVLR